jgi:hypothetical protein
VEVQSKICFSFHNSYFMSSVLFGVKLFIFAVWDFNPGSYPRDRISASWVARIIVWTTSAWFIFHFLTASILISIVVVLVHISHQQSVRVPPPNPKSLIAFVIVCLLDNNHSEWDEKESQGNFGLYFLFGKGC